ncbi:hypothetical protein FRC03_011471 [Tulasnella sp. 419]|nr:hypothetical protein FRC03_011471 [Tulasnella sp. 419]
MVSDCKSNHPLEEGTYLIRTCVRPNPTLNVAIREDLGKEPYACVWITTRSPSQLWSLEPTEKGYYIRNRSTNRYLSHVSEDDKNGGQVRVLDHAVEWKIEEIEDNPMGDFGPIYRIQLVSKPNISADMAGSETRDGLKVHLWDWHGAPNQRWILERIADKLPPPCDGPTYVGVIPAGIYWLGQPQEAIGSCRDRNAQSKAGLSVAAARPLASYRTASAHLFTIGADGPFSNQIWEIEAGINGYRLKNMGTKSYLNCLNRALVAEPPSDGYAGVTEWIFRQDTTLDHNGITDFWIHPSTDHTLILGVSKSDMLHQACVKPLNEYQNEVNTNFTQWRFEAVEEGSLEGV